MTTNSGNLNAPPPKAFGYDYRNQLIRFDSQRRVTTYRYDCFGRRIETGSGAGRDAISLYGLQHEIENQNCDRFSFGDVCLGRGRELLSRSSGRHNISFTAIDLGGVRRSPTRCWGPSWAADYEDYGKPSFFDGAGNPVRPRPSATPGCFYL